MKVDFYLPPGPVRFAADQARHAENLGYDGVFSTDTSHEPFFPLVAAVPATERVDLGTAITVAFARSPMTVAYSAWDLADLSDGRFLLGLGSQVRGHIVRRFSMPWNKPGPQMREYIAALRAVWDTWQNGTPLSFKGDYYELTLMTPFFDPGPIKHPDVAVYIAGVGTYMSRLAGEVCQGFHVHPFHSVRYLDEVVLENMAEGATAAGRSLDDVEVVSSVFVITGRDESEIQAAKLAIRQQVAFYASTPAYGPVLETHGWEFGRELTAMSKRGEWAEMAEVISDDVLAEVAVEAPIDELGARIRERYGDRVQRVGLYTPVPPQLSDEEWAELVSSVKN